jgi:hypothetical protein
MDRFLIILTTIPHYRALHYVSDPIYQFIIIASTTMSITWHYLGEPNSIIKYLDYFMAAAWSVYEIYLGYSSINFPLIIILNYIVLLTNNLISGDYGIKHSLWHLMSFVKCIFVAYILAKYNK